MFITGDKMSFLYLFILVLVSGMVTVIVKFYNKRNEGVGNASGLYNILFAVGAVALVLLNI